MSLAAAAVVRLQRPFVEGAVEADRVDGCWIGRARA